MSEYYIKEVKFSNGKTAHWLVEDIESISADTWIFDTEDEVIDFCRRDGNE